MLPSKFEPCGLEDFIAQLYGTIPVAHATGGLKKIIDGKTGFLYEENSGENLFRVLNELADLARSDFSKLGKIIACGAESVQKKYDWTSVIRDKYLPFYREL